MVFLSSILVQTGPEIFWLNFFLRRLLERIFLPVITLDIRPEGAEHNFPMGTNRTNANGIAIRGCMCKRAQRVLYIWGLHGQCLDERLSNTTKSKRASRVTDHSIAINVGQAGLVVNLFMVWKDLNMLKY
jgi:hypothetical protein